MGKVVAIESFGNIKENDVLYCSCGYNKYEIHNQNKELICEVNKGQLDRYFSWLDDYIYVSFPRKSFLRKKEVIRYNYRYTFKGLSEEGIIQLIKSVSKYIYRLRRLDDDILKQFESSITGVLNDLDKMFNILNEEEFIEILIVTEGLFKEMYNCANAIYLKVDKEVAENNKNILKIFKEEINIRTQVFKDMSNS